MLTALLIAAQTIAVLEFRDSTDLNAAYLADQVRAAVKEMMPSAKVITRENMLVLLQASGKDLAGCEGECEVDTGRRIGADLVVSGELLRFGTQYKLNMKLHDTRSGELISGAVASGATADELDAALRPAVGKLLATLLQDELSDRRAAARPAAESARFAWTAHAVAGYGNASGGPEIVTVLPGGISAATGALSFGGGADAGVRFAGPLSLSVYGEYAAVAGDTWVSVLALGVLARAQVTPAFSLAAGAGYAHLASSVSGWSVLGAADYRIYGPLAAHAQVLVANQATSNGLFPGGDEVVCLTAGLSVLY